MSVSHDTIQFTKEIIMHQLGIKPGVVFGTPTDELLEEVEDYFVKRFYTCQVFSPIDPETTERHSHLRTLYDTRYGKTVSELRKLLSLMKLEVMIFNARGGMKNGTI